MKTIAQRMREALDLRQMRQAELVELTGIGKSSISTYLSGAYEPKQRNIYKIAKALNVSEAWLMGYDAPINRSNLLDDNDNPPTPTPLSTDEVYIMDKYRGFNDEGKGKVTAYIDDLDKIGIYKK